MRKTQPKLHTDRAANRVGFFVEPLETRRLLAGLVNVTTNGAGDVTLTGDNLDNDIRIVLDRAGNQSYLVIEGENDTEIGFADNVADFATVPISSTDSHLFMIDRDLRIRMRGGDDDVEILAWHGGLNDSLVISRDLDATLGSGSDQFVMIGQPLTGGTSGGLFGGQPSTGAVRNIRVAGGPGGTSDYIELERLRADQVIIDTGAAGIGLDQAFFRDGLAVRLRMTGAAGESELVIQNSLVGEAELRSGSGADQVLIGGSRLFELSIDAGTTANDPVGDYVSLGSSHVLQNASIRGGAGRTHVVFEPSAMGLLFAIEGNLDIRTGGGDDVVRFSNGEPTIVFGQSAVNTGAGDDVVVIEGQSQFGGDVEVNLGGGDDRLEFEFDPVVDILAAVPFPPTFVSELIVRGGAGIDTIQSLGVVDLSSPLNDTSIEVFQA